MTTLVLDSQQSELVSHGSGDIVVVDDSGRRLGILVAEPAGDEPPMTLSIAEIELIRQRMLDPIDNLPTTAEVLQRIKARAGQ